MRVRASILAALAVVLAAQAGLALEAAEAQPFSHAIRVADGRGRERREDRREGRDGGERAERGGYRQGYAAPPVYAPAPAQRAYAYPQQGYPAQAYPSQDYRGQPQPYPQPYPYAERAAPPQSYPGPRQGYAAAPPQAYAPAPQGAGRNSLGAYWGLQQDAARRGVRQGNIPLRDVTGNIRRIAPGRMLDAGLEPGPDGRPAYRVRWAATNGRRIDFIVDAQTGAIIGQNGY